MRVAGYVLLHGLRFPAWLVMVLVVAVLLAFRLLEWHYQTYTLTNQRVITSYGVLNRVSESLGIEKVQHTTLSRGIVARFFGYGDIVIRSAGKGEELLKHIADADSFSLALVTAMSGGGRRRGWSSASSPARTSPTRGTPRRSAGGAPSPAADEPLFAVA